MSSASFRFREIIGYMAKRAPLLFARNLIELAVGLVTLAVLARTLSKDQYAVYSLLLTFVTIARLTALPGLGQIVTQSFARGARGIYRRAVLLSFAGTTVGAVAILLGGFWNLWVGHTELGQMLLLAAALFPFVAGLMLWRDAALGAEAYTWFLLFEGGSNIIRGVAIVASAYFLPGMLLPVVLASLAAPALTNVIATAVRVTGTPGSSHIEPGAVRHGLEVSAYQLPTVLAQHLDKLLIFYMISPAAAALYVVAQRIPEIARSLVGDTNATLGPLFARTDRYTPEMNTFAWRLWAVYLAVSIFGALFVVPFILPILVGGGYQDAILPCQIMTAGIALENLGNIQFRFVKSQMDSKSFLRITLWTAGIGLLLTVALGATFGFWGVVAAYVLKAGSYSIITNQFVRRKQREMPV